MKNYRTNSTPNRTGKKLLVSTGLILVSIIYAFFQSNTSPSNTPSPLASANDSSPSLATNQTSSLPPPKKTVLATTVKSPKVVTKTNTTPTTPAPKPAGQYADGTYTGSAADAYYGNIQVQAVIQNGALADVIFLQHPSDRGTSIRINNYAMPILKQEAISAQNANVDTVSGASDSSQAFRQSLASALAQA
ncbi:MAG: FMN-binding protein [Candidatus Pacebacteria bacterium]|nr:FMN-binding protein [Candidatus Paceibacterota bacterium]